MSFTLILCNRQHLYSNLVHHMSYNTINLKKDYHRIILETKITQSNNFFSNIQPQQISVIQQFFISLKKLKIILTFSTSTITSYNPQY